MVDEKKDEEEITLDFSKVKRFFKKKQNKEDKKEEHGKKAHEKHETHHDKKEKDDEVSIDFKGVLKKAYESKWVVISLLLLIPLIFSMTLRMQPASLSITDDWATDTVYQAIKSQISTEITKAYPNLPEDNRNALVEEKFQELLSSEKDQIDAEIERTSQAFKERMKNENGTTYLVAIDPYFWWRHAKNIVDHGYPGDIIVDGVQIDTHMYAPLGRPVPGDMFHAYFEAYLYKLIHIFNNNMTLFAVAFLTPVILASLAVIPAFFIGRRLGGNVSGFVAAMIVAIHPALLNRTCGGFADTDAYNVLFPLLVTWMFLEAFEAEKLSTKMIYASIAGIFVGFFAFAWGGWWFVVWFLLAVAAMYFIYVIVMQLKSKKGISSIVKNKEVKNIIYIAIIFFIVSAIAVISLTDKCTFKNIFWGPMGFSEIKDVGVSKVWPNVFTTVAEQNEADYNAIVSQIGGSFLFFASILGGILLMLIKKEKKGHNIMFGLLVLLWIASTVYASTKGVRWVLILVPAFALGVGVSASYAFSYVSRWLNKEMHINRIVSNTVIFLVIFGLIFLFPYNMVSAAKYTAKNEIPSMNDAWYNALYKISQESKDDAIINSWWDFGHWFKAIGDRAVTFDGTSQDTPMAHWIGNALLTDDEDVAVGILRMLDCGSNNAFEVLNKRVNKTYKSVDILYEIIVQDKETARETLTVKYGIPEDVAENVLKYTHCDPPEDFFITSDDMVGKSGVWAHFGSWDFKKATIFNKIKTSKQQTAIDYLKTEFGYSEEDAQSLYFEVSSLDIGRQANDWIAPWPSYGGGPSSCSVSGRKVSCQAGFEVDLDTMDATVNTQQGKMYLKSLVYTTLTDVKTKEFNDNTIPYSGVLIPNGAGGYSGLVCDPKVAPSMFTRLYFLKGHGLKHFDPFTYEKSFTGNEIYIWKVDWTGQSANIENNYLPPEEVEVSHILIKTDNRTDIEAQELADDIYSKATKGNFAQLAKEYSEDSSANNGGDLGWTKKGYFMTEFEDRLKNMTVGEIAPPIKTKFGYHILMLSDRRGGIYSLEEAK